MLSQGMVTRLRLPDMDDMGKFLQSLSVPTLVSMGAVAAMTTYYLATRPKALPSPCDLRTQSREIQVRGGFARDSVLLNGDGHMTHFYDDARTMYEFLLRGVRVSNDGPCLGSRKPKQPYEWLSYKQVLEKAEHLGSAFLHRGHSQKGDPHVGIFSQNRPEWTITELACYTYSLVSVPLYDTLGLEAITYILDKAVLSTIVCDVAAKVELVLECVRDREHTVKTIVLMEPPSRELASRGQQAGIQILSLQEMELLTLPPLTFSHSHQPPRPEDMAIICFTSGTTGNTHTHTHTQTHTHTHYSITTQVPMCHGGPASASPPLNRASCPQGLLLVHGGRIGYFQGDIRLLMDDLATLKPTIFPVVPRLLNRMFDKIYGQANSSLKRWVLGFAYRRKEAELKRGIIRRDSIWDRLIFRKVQDSLGGRVRLMITGAAPVSPTVLTFLRAALGCQFYEGYGQTECTAGCTLSMPGDFSAGHVGAPLPCNAIKLVDVADMNYLASNGEGEVCVKGPNVFIGYLKDPEKTEEALDADGWLHTGDIGKWLPNGTLKIVDRKKNIFKLAQGEYIAPEKIENVYVRSDALAQVFVHGDSLQACLVAVVVPDPDFLCGWVKKSLGLEGSYLELSGRQEVKAAILDDLLTIGKQAGLKSFEQVKAIHVHDQMFSVQNGLLTPTLKAKRTELQARFRAQIDVLYAGVRM
uniref:Arachidonate--CoA ligase n=1 Tax=Gadus morhua TaxID=8049 RepID=A0A8C5APX0_GADMO